jgi:hypothetical protein
VNVGGTLAGTGAVNGPVTLNGAIAPGNGGVGTLTTGAETWNGGGSYVCGFNSTNANGCDLLNISGALNVQATPGAPFTLKLASLSSGSSPGPLAGFNKFRNYTWTIAAASGGLSNFATNKFAFDTSAFLNDCSGGGFAVNLSGNSLLLNYLAAPLVFPQFTSTAANNGGVLQFTATGGANQTYVLLGTTNLPATLWMPLATNTADATGLVQFSTPASTNAPAGFFRLSTP